MPSTTQHVSFQAVAPPVAEWKDVPLTGDPYGNVDEIELSETSPVVQDAYVDELDCTVKRPGLTSFVDTTTAAGCDGLYWWDQQTTAIVVSNGRVWKITDSAGTKTELTGTTMAVGTLVTFATDGTNLIMANGGRMVLHVAGTSTIADMADIDAPTDVTHVAFIDTYILANSTGNRGRFYYSDVGSSTSWNSLSFATAEGSPDVLTAIGVSYREIALVGRESVEIWVDDGVTPFSRLPGAFIQRGCAAPYSFQQVSDPKLGDTWMWLDENRRFVKLAQRTPVYISNPYDKLIQGLLTVDNARAMVTNINGWPIYLISFPLAGKTLAYNFQKEQWMQWGYWDANIADYTRYRGQVYCYARGWNLHLMGDHSNGLIYTTDRSTFSDNGAAIRTLRRTGFITHGSLNLKRSQQLRIRCKRGVATATVIAPLLTLRWRDRSGAWSADHQGSLGEVGQTYFEAVFNRLGEYRARQYELIHSDATDCIIVSAQELVKTGPR